MSHLDPNPRAASSLAATAAGRWLPLLSVAAPAALPVAWWHSRAAGLGTLGTMAAAHGLLMYGTLRANCQWFGRVVTGFTPDPQTPGEVWLTVDDGPDPEDTPRMLDALDAANGARATFFVRGDRARAHPELIAEIVRRGHSLGNHTLTHPQATFWCAGPRRAWREISGCSAVLRELTGSAPRWFRAPVGMVNPFVPPVVAAHGMRLIGWSARGFDGVTRHAEPGAVVERILRDLRPGGVVLLHEGRRSATGERVNVQAMERLLAALAERGWRGIVPEEGRMGCGL